MPPVNNATDRPWKRVGAVRMVVFQGVIPSQGRNTEKNPVIGVLPWVCFNCPERVTNACFVQETEPEMVAVPVVGSIVPNFITLGVIASGVGPGTRLKTRFPVVRLRDDTSK